jgi:hypothetical protein
MFSRTWMGDLGTIRIDQLTPHSMLLQALRAA